MSGAEPLRDDRREAEPGTLEPTMEEILASIRRILADGHGVWDGAQELAAASEAMELGPDRRDAPEARPSGRCAPPPAGAAAPKPPLERRRPEAGRRFEPLASAATEASVAAAFRSLVAGRFVQSTDLVADLTREMLRPMLEAWLDAHLPDLVERLVAAEIARISRGE